jgi:hypothetical protein
MAISRLSAQDCKGASTTTSATATYPGATTAGNLLIATATSNLATDLDIAGWSRAASFGLATATADIFYRIATGTETTVTVTGGNTVTKIHAYEYSGLANPAIIDVVGALSNGSGVTATTKSVTTQYANTLLIAVIAAQGSVTAPSFVAPFNILQTDAATIRLMDAEQIVSAAAAYSATANWTTAQITRTVIAAFRDAAAPPVTNSFLHMM